MAQSMVRESRHIDSIIGLLWWISKLYLKFILAVFLSPVYSTPSVFFLLLKSLPFLCYSLKQNKTAFYHTTFYFLRQKYFTNKKTNKQVQLLSPFFIGVHPFM